MNKLIAWCKADDANLLEVLDIILDDDKDGYEDQVETIFIKVYGERVECPKCGSGVFPDHECEYCCGCENDD